MFTYLLTTIYVHCTYTSNTELWSLGDLCTHLTQVTQFCSLGDCVDTLDANNAQLCLLGDFEHTFNTSTIELCLFGDFVHTFIL